MNSQSPLLTLIMELRGDVTEHERETWPVGCGHTAAKQTGSWHAGHGLEPHLQELSRGEEGTQGGKGQLLGNR